MAGSLGLTVVSRPLVVLFAALVLLSSGPQAARGAESKRSYYEVLEVPKDADAKAIKSAYRKLALKYHPDKNPDDREGAEKKFREVAEAYEVLSDPDRRKKYDAGGDDIFGGQGGFGGGGFGGGFRGFRDANDIFKDMFGTDDPFANFDSFFEDVSEEMFGGGDQKDDSADMVKHLSEFYIAVGQPDKANEDKIRELLDSKKWSGKAHGLPKAMRKKYPDPKYARALDKLESSWPKAKRKSSGHSFGGGFGGLGDAFGGFGASFGGGFGGGGGSSFSSFSFSSSSSGGGRTVKTETVIQNGKRVTKTIESDGKTTKASMEEEEGGRTRRKSGVKQNEQLPNRDEM